MDRPAIKPPGTIYVQCPVCGEETQHRVHKGRFVGKKNRRLEMVVECTECGHVHEEVFEEEKEVRIPLMTSYDDRTTRGEITLPVSEEIRVGDVLYNEKGERIVLSAIEVGEKRVRKSRAGDITALWARARNRVKVRVSIHRGDRTVSKELILPYDEEIYVGDMIDFETFRVVVHRIKTEEGVLHRGGAPAEKIVRVYANIIRRRGR